MNLETLKNRTILLLGKPRAFSQEEFAAQLKAHEITLRDELREGMTTILEGRMMTPYEQNLSEELYEKGGFEFINMEHFEKALAAEIDDDVLLMSLKLSKDKERLKSFLQNSCVSDALFFRLLKMYDWQSEDFFENDDNRDVTAALIGRFYENIERNHNVQYATTGLIHLVRQTQNAQLLEEISNLQPLKFHPKIVLLLATHPNTPQNVLKRFVKEGDDEVLKALCVNPSLDASLAKVLLEREDLARKIAENITLDEELFSLLRAYKKELAENETLTPSMQEELLDLEEEVIDSALSTNQNLTKESVQRLLKRENEALAQRLYENRAVNEDSLREAFQEQKYNTALAKNVATPKDILTALYQTGDDAVLDALARNENTPVEILYQLQLESRFDRAVKTNKAFGKHIQSENIGWLV